MVNFWEGLLPLVATFEQADWAECFFDELVMMTAKPMGEGHGGRFRWEELSWRGCKSLSVNWFARAKANFLTRAALRRA